LLTGTEKIIFLQLYIYHSISILNYQTEIFSQKH